MAEDVSPDETDDPELQGHVQNVGLKRGVFGAYTIEGYSRAAVQTCWRIPEMKIGFDLGAQPWSFMGTPTWFVSHAHLDHIAALAVYVSRRRMMKMSPPTIYLPTYAIDAVEAMLDAFGRLDRGRLPCNLIGVEAGQEYDLSRELCVTVHRTYHTIPSVGFIVWERRRKLKEEYLGLPGIEIKKLRESGVAITNDTRIPVLAYLGDSTPAGLDRNPDMYRAKILITEMTFVAASHRKEKIHKNGHMHLDDYIERREKFENEVIIASHFSTRYTDSRIEKIVNERMPDRLDNRLQLWL